MHSRKGFSKNSFFTLFEIYEYIKITLDNTFFIAMLHNYCLGFYFKISVPHSFCK